MRKKYSRRAGKGLAVTTDPAPSRTSLVASAVNVRVTAGFSNIRWGATDWQQEGWLHYDNCPEFGAGVRLMAWALSRARLIAVDIDPITGDPGTQPTKDADVAEIMGDLFGGPAGQSQALKMIGKHLTVAGDLWVLATDNPDLDQATWEVLGTTEVSATSADRIVVEQMNGLPREIDTENELLVRIWEPHPKRRWEADAATRSLLPVLRELAALTNMVSATVKSRLASSGILWIPEEIQLPKPTAGPAADDTQVRSESAGAQGWLDLITEAMIAPIRDPDSAQAVVPLVSLVKGDLIEKITHMEFGRDLDQMIQPLRDACVLRLAVGMDLPPEKLTGSGDINHWGQWSITEDFAKQYIAPKLELVAAALTTYYLAPALRARRRNPRPFAIYFDLNRLLPNQINVDNAVKAWDAGLLKELAYMEALGFAASDIADSEERARRLITELLSHGNPQTLAEVGQAIAALFPGITIQPLTPTGGLGAPITAPGHEPAALPGRPAASEPTPTPSSNAPPARPPASNPQQQVRAPAGAP
jgi:hypothetical protein